MAQPPHNSPSSIILVRLPEDVLYLVGRFSSFESLASLVRCNRWFYQTCSSLLFREIRLHSLTQIIKLCENEKAMQMINRTKSLILRNTVFGPVPEQFMTSSGISLPAAADCIIRMLYAMTSLLQIQISGPIMDAWGTKRDLYGDIYYLFIRALVTCGSDATFLPNLANISEFYTRVSLGRLCPDRPILYRYRLEPQRLHLDICPELSNTSAPAHGIISEATHSLSANDIGSIIRKNRPTSLLGCPNIALDLTMRFPDEIRRQKPCPITDINSWIQATFATANLPDQFWSINIQFQPVPVHHSLEAQLSAIEDLHKSFPSLESAIISFPHSKWSRLTQQGRAHPTGASFKPSDLPVWTVFPQLDAPETIHWWCKILNLGDVDAQTDEEVKQSAKKLNDAMLSRWSVYEVPSVLELIGYFGRK